MTRFHRIAAHMLTVTPGRERSLAWLMLGTWAMLFIWLQWDHWAEDIAAVYVAGWLWQQGQPDLIYAARPMFFGGAAAAWEPALAQIGIAPGQIVYPYVYPPLWAALTAPITTLIGPQGFANAVSCVQMPMLAGSVLLAARILRPRGWPLWLSVAVGVVLLSSMIQPFIALYFNQPSITVNFLTLLAIERLSAGRAASAGIALAVATAMKLNPAAFALIFVIDRQWRALAWFAAVGAALGLLSLILTGPGPHFEMLVRIDAISDIGFFNGGNVSLRGVILSVASALSLAPPIEPTVPPFVISQVPGWIDPTLSVLAAALILAFGLALRHHSGPYRRGVALLALSIIVPLFGPLGWLHYYVLPLLLLPGLYGILPLRQTLFFWTVIGFSSLSVVFAQAGNYLWHVSYYIWPMSAIWLALLAALLVNARQPARLPPE